MSVKQTKSARRTAPSRARGSAPDWAPKRAKANAFPKSARLLKHASFQEVYERGRKHFSTNMIFFYLLGESALDGCPTLSEATAERRVGERERGNTPKAGAPPLSPAFADRLGTKKAEPGSIRIGLTVGRALGGAVDRNRIKRRMRDLVRHNLGTLREALTARGISAEVVINPKKAALTADKASLHAEVARGFAVIAQAANPSGAANSR